MMRYLLFCSIFFLSCNALANEENLFKGKELTILSDQLQYERDKNIAIFTDDVHAYQKSLNIYGEKMVVELHEKNSKNSSGGKIKHIVITDNVKIITDNEKISSDTAEYKPSENKIIMKGNVELLQNNNIVTGDELIYDTVNKSAKIISKDKNTRIKAKFTFGDDE